MVDVSSIVVSSRIRLARSLDNYLFPVNLIGEEGYNVIKDIADVVLPLGDYKIFTMQQLPVLDAEVMQEKHLISKKLLENKDNGAVILSGDESISIMINEEDHIRAQCFLKGLSLDKAYDNLSRVDDAIINKLEIAYDPKLGFLNSCITNVGTGMRASVMMFLPGLTLAGEMDNVINLLSNQGLTVRGVFGEGSVAQGYMYQVSNARSLGMNEKDIIVKVTSTCLKLCDAENAARKSLIKDKEIELKDRVFRAFGTLTNAYTITASEFMKCAGEIKIGLALGFLKFKDNTLIDRLMFDALPSTLTKMSGEEALSDEDENLLRAKFVAKTLKNARIN